MANTTDKRFYLEVFLSTILAELNKSQKKRIYGTFTKELEKNFFFFQKKFFFFF